MKGDLLENRALDKKIVFFLCLSLCVVGCIKKSKTKEVIKEIDFGGRQEQPLNKSDNKPITSGIYYVQTSGLFQRGFRIFKNTTHSVGLAPRGPLSSLFVSNGTRSISVPIRSTLTASINKSGPGGITSLLSSGAEEGATLYLITKDSGLEPALILIPKKSDKFVLPDSYTFSSEPLWYVFKERDINVIRDFVDFGDGINVYYRSGLYKKEHKFLLNRTKIAREIRDMFVKVPHQARYILLDVTVVLRNQMRRSFLDITLDRGSGVTVLVERLMFSPTREERIYRKIVQVPVLNSKQGGVAKVKIQTKGLSSFAEEDGHAYIYVKGWKIVNNF